MKNILRTLACAVALSCGVALAEPHGGHGGGGHISGGGHFSGGAHFNGGHINSGHFGGGGHFEHRGGHYYGGYGGGGGIYYGGDIGVPDYGGYYYGAAPGYDDSYDVSPAPVDSMTSQVQSLLQQQGYYQGAVDGEMGPATQAAISNYQSNHGLVVTGVIDAPLLRSLGIQ